MERVGRIDRERRGLTDLARAEYCESTRRPTWAPPAAPNPAGAAGGRMVADSLVADRAATPVTHAVPRSGPVGPARPSAESRTSASNGPAGA